MLLWSWLTLITRRAIRSPHSVFWRPQNGEQPALCDANPSFSAEYSGFVLGQNESILAGPSFDTDATQSSAVGSYDVMPKGLTSSNYAINFAKGTLKVLSWDFKGFYNPVNMSTATQTVYNTVKNGSTVPIKLEVFKGVTEQTDTAIVKTPLQATKVNCTTSAVEDVIELTATGSTALRYDTTEGQFIYNWKTPTSAGACYKVTISTNDGSSQTAYFKLK